MRGRSCAPDKAGGEHQKPWGMSHACAPATVGSGPCASRVAVDRSTSSASGFARYPTVFDALLAHCENRPLGDGYRYLRVSLLPPAADQFARGGTRKLAPVDSPVRLWRGAQQVPRDL